MTGTEWLVDRTAAAPRQLRERIMALVSNQGADGAAPESIADVAVAELTRLLASRDDSRAVAGDLLAIDALVTYACEAAAERWQQSGDDPAVLLEWCDRFAVRIGAIAAAHGTP